MSTISSGVGSSTTSTSNSSSTSSTSSSSSTSSGNKTTGINLTSFGSVSSGTGLISGLNIQDIVTKLTAIDSLIISQNQSKIDRNTELQNTLNNLSLQIVSANLNAGQLGKGGALTFRNATSSSTAVTATAARGATIGSFQFTPRRLVSTSQVLSTGYASNTDSVTSTATTFKISQGGFVNKSTNLSSLNGGQGVRTGTIKIVDGSGGTSTVDLTGSTTIQDIVEAINGTAGANVIASVKGDQLQLLDNSGGVGTLQVQDVAGGQAAADLGLKSLTRNGSTYSGQDIFNLGNNLALSTLRDGNGIRDTVGNDFSVSAGSVSFNVDISSAKTVGDVLDLINNNSANTGGKIVASLSGDRLVLTDSQGTDAISISAIGGSKAASDLGLTNGSGGAGVLTGNDILGSLNTVLLSTLNGGSATASPTPGTLTINGTNIDLSNATTLQDVIDGINGAGITGVSAAVNKAGNGIAITAQNVGSLTVSDTSGNLGSFLNINGTKSGNNVSINSGDLNAQYINENTQLSSFGSATGVPKGKIQITDGNGKTSVIDLTQDTDDTIGDVIREINTRGLAVSARINNTGDGIFIQNIAGTGSVTVAEVDGGTTAKALGLLKTPDSSGNVDGSLEVSISVAAGTSLKDLVTQIQQANAPVTASILNDGSNLNPFRLSLTSNRSGAVGQLLIDTGATNVSLSSISNGRDAVALYGASGSGGTPLQVISSSNTFSGLVPGVSVTATDVSTSPVTVTVNQDTDAAVAAVQKFVDSYNGIRSFINTNTQFDADSISAGLLFTDSTTRIVKSQLVSFVNSFFGGSSASVRSLGQLGIKLSGDGTLTFDNTKFKSVLASDPTGVNNFLTNSTSGLAVKFQTLTDTLTSTKNGTITTKTTQLSTTIQRQTNSLDALSSRLTAKQTLLLNQFYSMETALSAMKGQLATLTALTSTSSTG